VASSKNSKTRQRVISRARKDLRELKKLGLFSGDLRKKPSRYGVKQTQKFADVLRKQSKVIEAPSRKIAKGHKEQFKVKGRKIIVPVKKGEKVLYSKKTGEIFTYRREMGVTIKGVYPKNAITPDNIDSLPQGKNIRYALPIGIGGRMERMTFAELKALPAKYKRTSLWKAYLQIEYLSRDDQDDHDAYGDDDE
jgi:hypothetical protein